MTNADDRSLVREVLAGDVRAFEVLVGRYSRVLYNVAYRLVGDHDEALDVTQTTFLKAFHRLDTFDPQYRFFSWIYRIARNEALNRRARRAHDVGLDPDLVAWQAGPDEECEAHERADAIQAALGRLTAEQREVVVLRHFQALSYREIAAMLDLPESTVKSRLFEARRNLGALLAQGGAAR